MNIFERLKNERERLDLTQPRVGDLLGVGKTTVIRWEKGESAPDAVQLSAFAASGADVLYILTGQRSQGLPAQATLPPDEQVLLDSYRRCNSQGRQNLIQTAALLSAGMGVSPPTAPASVKHRPDMRGMNMNNNTPGGVQVGYAAGEVKIKKGR